MDLGEVWGGEVSSAMWSMLAGGGRRSPWCELSGRWLRFDHNTVVEYRLDADQSCIVTFANVVPLRLSGPSAWCHAVLYAYLQCGAAWQTAPFLRPVRQAAQQLVTAPH